MNEVTPWLFVGSKKQVLFTYKRHRITHVVTLCGCIEDPDSDGYDDADDADSDDGMRLSADSFEGAEWCAVPLSDHGNSSISDALTTIAPFVGLFLSNPDAGVDRCCYKATSSTTSAAATTTGAKKHTEAVLR